MQFLNRSGIISVDATQEWLSESHELKPVLSKLQLHRASNGNICHLLLISKDTETNLGTMPSRITTPPATSPPKDSFHSSANSLPKINPLPSLRTNLSSSIPIHLPRITLPDCNYNIPTKDHISFLSSPVNILNTNKHLQPQLQHNSAFSVMDEYHVGNNTKYPTSDWLYINELNLYIYIDNNIDLQQISNVLCFLLIFLSLFTR